MFTNTGPTRRTTQDASLDEHPIKTLLRDHNLVRKLAEHYLNDHSAGARKQAAIQLVQAVHNLERLKETVFYPGVRRVAPNLVAHLEEESLDVDDVLAALSGMALDDARAEPLVRELIDAVLKHMRDEETQLFPMLRHAALDLAPIGLEMRAYEANLVHMQARRSDRGVLR
jgi:uncharacterized membrane-anchored protein YjiN (DUF445 family)